MFGVDQLGKLTDLISFCMMLSVNTSSIMAVKSL